MTNLCSIEMLNRNQPGLVDTSLSDQRLSYVLLPAILMEGLATFDRLVASAQLVCVSTTE